MTSPPRAAVCCPGFSAEMETSLRHQSLALLLALAMGLGLGLLYDLLRPPRRHAPGILAGVLDVLFALASGASLFLYAMGADNGRLGLWELCGALLGFLLYQTALSPWVLRVLEPCFQVVENIMLSAKKNLKKCVLSAKKFFPNVREWIIMKR